jgi:hypothetical protein
MIVEAVIHKMVVHSEAHARTPERWRQSIEDAHRHLAHCGVVIESIPMKKPIKTLFDGEAW